jgi:hypothetical protein
MNNYIKQEKKKKKKKKKKAKCTKSPRHHDKFLGTHHAADHSPRDKV